MDGSADTRTNGEARVVHVFVSSPIDVAPERGRVQAVAAKLNRAYDGLLTFETLLWEERFYKADKSFQPQITEPAACDIVISIFWTRIGSELPADFPRMPDGRPYPSGTAYELITALEASKSKSVPNVYVFRKTADAPIATTDAERRCQALVRPWLTLADRPNYAGLWTSPRLPTPLRESVPDISLGVGIPWGPRDSSAHAPFGQNAASLPSHKDKEQILQAHWCRSRHEIH